MEFEQAFADEPEVASALKDLADNVLATIERDGGEAELPDPMEHLESRGVRLASARTLRLQHTAAPENVQPAKPIPPGCQDCWPTKCKMIKGEVHCVWVCSCD
jgi:hypothetical protein